MVAKDNVTLENVLSKCKTKQIRGEHGSDSSARGIIGTAGSNVIVEVPSGITIYNQNGVSLGRYTFPSIIVIACVYQNEAHNK